MGTPTAEQLDRLLAAIYAEPTPIYDQLIDETVAAEDDAVAAFIAAGDVPTTSWLARTRRALVGGAR